MNRLAREKSPYLLQHADNPVDWYPWGEEAFEKARADDKPIFLSVGYSTCHWCHVMAHESFESGEVAALLNDHFVSIKVDREERPDVDRIYMSFVQATTGAGGWPMSVWLMPDLRPFYGGTYFPPRSAWGRPGFNDLLREMARLWREDRSRVEAAAAGVIEHLASAASGRVALQVPGAIALDGAVRDLLAQYDSRRGGFGAAPKFPRPSELLFLLREHRRTGDQPPLGAVLHTLRAMAAGGMRDQLGGGFHRYSVDAEWRVPHFEKMLYDQAQLVLAYVEAAQASGDRFFLDVAEDTLRYVRRDLTDAGGGFFSAEDADSLPPNVSAYDDHAVGQASGLPADADAVGQASGLPTDDHAVGQASGLPADADAVGQASGLPTDDHAVGQASGLPTDDHAVGQASGLPRKSEGAFYLWTADEIAVLGPDANLFSEYFGVAPRGNALEDPHGEFTGRNILYQARSADDIARELGRTREEVEAAIGRSKERLFTVREGRPRPHLDDKVLTAWNGLMIAGFARASRVAAAFEERPGTRDGGRGTGDGRRGVRDEESWRTGERANSRIDEGDGRATDELSRDEDRPAARADSYLAAAERAAAFIRERMWDAASGRLLRRYRDGEAAIDAYAEDYACLIFGLLELFQADGDPGWLEWAVQLQRLQDERFLDPDGGGWFSTSGEDGSLLLRLKEDYDGAEPTASSIGVLNLLTLSHLGVSPESGEAVVDRTLRLFGQRISQVPRAVPMMLCALSAWHAGMAEVVVAGDPTAQATQELVHAIDRGYQPFAVLVRNEAGTGRAERLAALLPWVAAMGLRAGRPTAYVCRNFACERPTDNPEQVAALLSR